MPLVLNQEELGNGKDEPGVVDVHQVVGVKLRRHDVSKKPPSEMGKLIVVVGLIHV